MVASIAELIIITLSLTIIFVLIIWTCKKQKFAAHDLYPEYCKDCPIVFEVSGDFFEETVDLSIKDNNTSQCCRYKKQQAFLSNTKK